MGRRGGSALPGRGRSAPGQSPGSPQGGGGGISERSRCTRRAPTPLHCRGRRQAEREILDEFNRVLARTVVRMRVASDAARSRREPRYEIAWREAGRLESILWPVVWSAASLMLSGDAGRIRVCGGPDCGWIYVDRSRNQLRRWCQMATCGTREKTRRRYRRVRGRAEHR